MVLIVNFANFCQEFSFSFAMYGRLKYFMLRGAKWQNLHPFGF